MSEFDATKTGMNIGKIVIAILLLSFIGIVVYKNYFSKLSSGGKDMTLIPKEMQLNYIPADYSSGISEEDALPILENPERNRQAFNKLVYDLNLSILNHVATRMNLGQRVRSQIKEEYEKHHPYLRNLYFQDFVSLKDTTSVLYQSWYNNESTNAVETLHEVAGKYTCFLVNHVITALVKTDSGSLYAKGKRVDTPCGIATTEALSPLMKRMEEQAAIKDFGRSRGILQEKVERTIAELATIEIQDKKGINKRMQTKIWGFNVSSSNVEISAMSVAKVGFRLHDYMDIKLNNKTGIVTVTLPQPTVLSHEVYPNIDKLDIGWLREVEGVDLNKNINLLREEFRRDIINGDYMEKSKTKAVELMNTMFGPLISNINRRYQLRVSFKENQNYENQLDASLATQ